MSRRRAAPRLETGRPAVALALALALLGARAAAQVPHFDHVVIVIEENKGYSQIIGSPQAPYINALATDGALMTRSYALAHPSQPNYIALFSGSTQGVTTDGVYPHSQFTAPNLGAKLLAAGLSFGGYSETMPSVGFDGATWGTPPAAYKRKHNPWVNWQDATVPLPANKLPPTVNMPYEGFFPGPADYDALPALCFVIPNQADDMHDGTVAEGDAWLQANLGAYASWCAAHESLLIVTFDEDNGSEGNRIVTIFYGTSVVPGQYGQIVDHYAVLRTLEDGFGLPHDAGSATAAPITNIWGPGGTVWTDLGYGLAGGGGVPTLVGTGTLAAGTPGTLTLSQAAPSALCTLFVSFSGLAAPFKCGTLVPVPIAFTLGLFTSGSGSIPASWTSWSGGLSGQSLRLQYAIQDAGAACGVALSNALRGDVP
jgi:acid phosphatase